MTQTVVLDGKTTVVLSGQIGPPGSSGLLSTMDDLDLLELENNSILVYDAFSQKWKSSKKLEDHLVNAGFF